MIKSGRIFSGTTPLTDTIEFELELDLSGGPRTVGTFRRPANFEIGSLIGGVGELELEDGRKARIYLLAHDQASGVVRFHVPGTDISD